MKTIKDLKQMISEPASKEWFEKHGSAKKAIAKKIGKELLINKPPSFFKEYSGGKRGFLKEEKITNEFRKGGKYYINKHK